MIRRLGFGLALLATLPGVLRAQFFTGYFGQNKVQYSSFNFKVLQTEHFDIYYYEETKVATLDAARIAERSYTRLSLVLNHQFKERKPIILYASPYDFQQTNVGGEEPGEGTGGFTDFLRQRNVLPFTGSYADLQHVITHEMTHQFQFDIWTRGRIGDVGGILQANAPLWYGEGMAEYMSLGDVNSDTAMWLRDAVLESRLPTIEQLTNDPSIFPYRYGHAVVAFIAKRWGDETIGTITKAMNSGGIEGALRRTLGLSQAQLSDLWRAEVQKQYLPELGDRVRGRSIAKAVLTQENSGGTLHLAPALSPDGAEVAYFSERNNYFVDFWLANATTGLVKFKLLNSTLNPNYETFRFLNSQASWSPDGRYLAFSAKKGSRDNLVLYDRKRRRVVKTIRVNLDGVTTPSWSPDGKRIVFTGYKHGDSNLYIINADGSDLKQLTDDQNAEFDPDWSPDGRTIAFVTDRGPATNFSLLTFGNFRLALYDLATGNVRLLDHMNEGKNVSPQWSPDGKTIAFVSDRDGVSNIYLYESAENEIYRITNFFTGVQGFTPLSPVLSWAQNADRLAFMYFERERYDVYTLDNPRGLKRTPYNPVVDSTLFATNASVVTDSTAPQLGPEARGSVSIYRGPGGFRPADSLPGIPPLPVPGVSPLPGAVAGGAAPGPGLPGLPAGPAPVPGPGAVSLAALMDSASLGLPDTSEFKKRRYRSKFEPDFVAQPTIGYQRDAFGRGLFGGTTIQLSDMLGNQQLIFSGYINGRPTDAQILAAYANNSRRLNYITGVFQQPYFFVDASVIVPGTPTPNENTLVTRIRRQVYRTAFLSATYPFNRFQRVELGVGATNVDITNQLITQPYDPFTGVPTASSSEVQTNLPNANFAQFSAAYVMDNSLMGYIAPFRGARYRFALQPAVGSWTFLAYTMDLRRYDHVAGPFTLATRLLLYGHTGRDANQYQIFMGYPDYLRGYTSGSFQRNECLQTPDVNSVSACPQLDRLIGTQFAIFNAELRFPLIEMLFGNLPPTVPPFQMAFFFDAGVAWNDFSKVTFDPPPGANELVYRSPVKSFGVSFRTNLFGFAILRLDYARPLDRTIVRSLWTLSLGPAF